MRTIVARYPLLVAAGAAILVTIWRATLMLGPQGAGPAMAFHFVALAITPFLFFRRDGRRTIGLTRQGNAKWAALAITSGVGAAALFGVIGLGLFGESEQNWFVTVRETMLADARLRTLERARLLPVLAIPAAIFSPIGEELFFRGVLAGILSAVVGSRAAAALTAVTFGVMHVFHHGVSMGPDGLSVLAVSGAIWIGLTAALSLMFTWLRHRGGSIWFAVAGHSAFNITMIFFIVAVLM